MESTAAGIETTDGYSSEYERNDDRAKIVKANSSEPDEFENFSRLCFDCVTRD